MGFLCHLQKDLPIKHIMCIISNKQKDVQVKILIYYGLIVKFFLDTE